MLFSSLFCHRTDSCCCTQCSVWVYVFISALKHHYSCGPVDNKELWTLYPTAGAMHWRAWGSHYFRGETFLCVSMCLILQSSVLFPHCNTCSLQCCHTEQALTGCVIFLSQMCLMQRILPMLTDKRELFSSFYSMVVFLDPEGLCHCLLTVL